MVNMKKIIKYAEGALIAARFGLPIYLAGLAGVQEISARNSPRIESQAHLEQILEAEKDRAGIEKDVSITVRLEGLEGEISHAKKLSDKKYEIVLCPRGSDLSTLRHELYHVADGHCDMPSNENSKLKNALLYLFRTEPQAVIYQTTGLKP